MGDSGAAGRVLEPDAALLEPKLDEIDQAADRGLILSSGARLTARRKS